MGKNRVISHHFNIGDIFEYKGNTYIIEKGVSGCSGCVFKEACSDEDICEASTLDKITLPRCDVMGCIYKKYNGNNKSGNTIDLTKILDGCPKGTRLYSTIFGDIEFARIGDGVVYFMCDDGCTFPVFKDGLYFNNYHGECTVFPSKDQRDWSKFVRFWVESRPDRFNPATLKAFDRVLSCIDNGLAWNADFFNRIQNRSVYTMTYGTNAKYVIPYNDDTKHLLGTSDEAPEYYRYWEDC